MFPAWAQTYRDSGGTLVPGVVPIPATVGGTASLAVTTASGTVAIPASDTTYPSINLTNAGTTALYYALGPAATTSSAYLGPGSSACIAAGSATTVAAITASSTTTLQLTQTNTCIVALNSGGGGGGGSGAVTSVATTCGTAGGPITTSGTITGALIFNVQTGTSYSTLATDCGKIVSFNNASTIAVTLNNATFSATNYVNVKVVSGSAVVTLTPSSGTIDGNANEPLTAKHSQTVVFDGTNWSTSGVYLVGPASAAIGDAATFGDVLGQSVADSGKTLPTGAVVGTTDSQSLTNKSIVGSEVNSGTVPLAQMPTVLGASPYLSGVTYTNPLLTGVTASTSAVGVANSYYCVPRWLYQTETVAKMWIRIVATSTGNTSNALQGAIYLDSIQTGTTACGAGGGSCHRPGTFVDFAGTGSTTGFPTGSAAVVSATMANGTDTLTGPGIVWDCVQTFDTTVTYGSSNNNAPSMIPAVMGSTNPSTGTSLLSATPLNSVSTNGSAFGGANWVNFTGSTSWTEVASAIHLPAMGHQSN